MKWHVYYSAPENRYKLTSGDVQSEATGAYDILASFKVFDMAYDYVTRMNGDKTQAYSRWTR